MSKNEEIYYQENGFAGMYYPGTKAPACAIISAGGSLASENDDMWPSEKCVERIREELTDYPHEVQTKIYPHGSHVLGITFDGLLKLVILPMIRKFIPTEKKYPAECEAARADSTARMLAFIKKWAADQTGMEE